MPVFSSEGQRPRSPHTRNFNKIPRIRHKFSVYLQVADQARRPASAQTLLSIGLTTVRPSLPSAPKTLGSWTDGHIAVVISVV